MSVARARAATFALLRERNFGLYWTGQAISFTGTWMQQLALSWAILRLSPGAFALGAVNFVGSLPPALLLLHGGVIADRFDRRRIILLTQLYAMCSAFLLAALVYSDRLDMWHIFATVAGLGVAMAFDLPATHAFVAELVPRESIGAAVSLNQAIFHGSRLIGPALAGLVVARFGTFAAFLANGLSYIPVILTLLAIRPQRALERGPESSKLDAMREGIAYVRARPDLAALLGIVALVIAFAFPQAAVQMPFYVKHVLGLDARALGTLMAVGGGSALLGSMLLLGVRPEARRARLKLGLGGLVTGLLLLAAAPRGSEMLAGLLPRLLLPALATFLFGLAISTTLGLVTIIIQQSVPDELRGRISSLQGLVFLGVLPFSSLAIAWLTDWLSMPTELYLAASLAALGSLWLSRKLDLSVAPGGGGDSGSPNAGSHDL